MKSNTVSIVSLVLVLMAVSSLVSMISTFKIDGIVHGDLYSYGLEFSYGWAVPYWTMTTIVFGMGWFNIITAIAFQFYVLIYGRKEALKSEISGELELLEPTKPEPAREEITETEAKSIEKVEESLEQATKPAEEIEKEPEQTQTVVEATPQQEQSEAVQTGEVEQQEEQESKPAEELKTETEETSTPATETEQETPEKSEETPILVGVPEEQPQTTTEETLQQV